MVRKHRYHRVKTARDELQLIQSSDSALVDYQLSPEIVIKVLPQHFNNVHSMLGHYRSCPVRQYAEQYAPQLFSTSNSRAFHLTAIGARHTNGLGLWMVRDSSDAGTDPIPDLEGTSTSITGSLPDMELGAKPTKPVIPVASSTGKNPPLVDGKTCENDDDER